MLSRAGCRYAREPVSQERMFYEALEHRARADGTGLWADRDPVPPWEWREQPPH